MHASTLLVGSGLVSLAFAGYTLEDDYSGDNFFNMMTFDTEDDPTHGYVNYVDKATAMSSGLAKQENGVVTLGADSTSVASGRGRSSTRVTSTKSYTEALVVLDLAHMPGNACGIWPAFWMTGPSWPNNGEIDIIEGVNMQTQNAMTMHTNGGCSMVSKSCEGNTGCGVQAGGPSSYGNGFNSDQGGIYALQWTDSEINVYFFGRGSIPGDLTSGSPNPDNWKPLASFSGSDGCNIADHFKSNSIIFDITFCGDWAGAVFSQDSSCSSKGSCQDYVQNTPSAFKEAYWTINSLKVYSGSGSGSSPVNGNSTSGPTPSQSQGAGPTDTGAPTGIGPPQNTDSPPSSSAQAGPTPSIKHHRHSQTPAPTHGNVGVGSSTKDGQLREYNVDNPNQASQPVATQVVPGAVQTVVAARSVPEAQAEPLAGSLNAVRKLARRHLRHWPRHRGLRILGSTSPPSDSHVDVGSVAQ